MEDRESPLETISWFDGIRKFPQYRWVEGKRRNVQNTLTFTLLPYIYVQYIWNLVMYGHQFQLGLWFVEFTIQWNRVTPPNFGVRFECRWPYPIYSWGMNQDGTKYLIRKSYWDFKDGMD